MKTYVGQRGRDRVLHVWVENYGRRSPMPGDDIAGRILADVFGARLVEDDYWCYQTFRDEVIGPRLSEAGWSLTETEVRDWRDAYAQQGNQRRKTAEDGEDAEDDQQERASDAQPTQPTDQEEHNAVVSWGSGITRARLLHATSSVLLLEGSKPSGGAQPLGAPLRVGLPGTPKMLAARLAAYGQGDRFLVSLGSRAVRGAARVRVDLAAVVRAASLPAPVSARVVDLSSSGARVRGIQLPVRSECDLAFTPPGRTDTVNVRCVVVRILDRAEQPEVGVAFCAGSLAFRADASQHRPA